MKLDIRITLSPPSWWSPILTGFNIIEQIRKIKNWRTEEPSLSLTYFEEEGSTSQQLLLFNVLLYDFVNQKNIIKTNLLFIVLMYYIALVIWYPYRIFWKGHFSEWSKEIIWKQEYPNSAASYSLPFWKWSISLALLKIVKIIIWPWLLAEEFFLPLNIFS